MGNIKEVNRKFAKAGAKKVQAAMAKQPQMGSGKKPKKRKK